MDYTVFCMKSWVWLILLLVVILAVFAVMAAFKPKTTEAPIATTEPVGADEELSPGAQPIQLVPEELPEITVSPVMEASPVAEQATVEINDTGFMPATVRVKAGTTVTFVNNGQALHWPASAPHPAHTDLPEFNAKKGLATGEEYAMMFDKVGTWRFHDHLNPTMTGSVVVE